MRSSHERVDGGGYPDGLAGDEIPLGSRIVAVCDTFDEMTSERPYQRSMSPEAAIRELMRHAGAQFDGEVVAAFRAEVAEPSREPGSDEPGSDDRVLTASAT